MSSLSGVDTGSYQGLAITASDTTTYSPPLAAIFIGTSTTDSQAVTVTHPDGTVTAYKNLKQGSILPVAAQKVMAASTATDLVGLR